MKATIESNGRTYYVVTTVPQVDGGLRYICAATAREARAWREIVRRDRARIDGSGLIPIDAR